VIEDPGFGEGDLRAKLNCELFCNVLVGLNFGLLYLLMQYNENLKFRA